MRNAKHIIRTVIALFIVSCFTILVGCGSPKYPKADLEVTSEAVNSYMINTMAALVKCKKQNKTFTAPDLEKDYQGKIVRVRGPVMLSAKSQNNGKPLVALSNKKEPLSDGFAVFYTMVQFKDNLSPQAEKKVSDKEVIVIQGTLEGMKSEKIGQNVAVFWKISDAVIIENDEFNTDGKADAVIKSYSKQIDNIRNN